MGITRPRPDGCVINCGFDCFEHVAQKLKTYDRHSSIESMKSITSITVITRKVVSTDFYRLIDTIDNAYVIDIDSYRFMERFSCPSVKASLHFNI